MMFYPGMVDTVKDALYVSRVALVNSSNIPFSSDVVARTKSTKRRLASTVALDLSEMSNGILTAWSTAQAVVSVSGFDISIVETHKIVDFINSKQTPGCECWAETSDRLRDFHSPFISGWIFCAYAEIGIPVPEGALNTLLSEQQEAGWWSTFPVNRDRQYASTYTTAWALLGLLRQKQKGYINIEKRAAVEKALTRGAHWLLSVRDHARWKSYPYSVSKESESISGLVLHVINQLLGEDAKQFNVEWLEKLPGRVILAGEAEDFYIEIPTPAGMAFDHWEQLKMPGLTVATVDAYSSGNVFQRAKALRWLENILDDESVSSSDARKEWWRAEVLYSLNYAIKQ
ncbi:MAG TPA: hypothetical protein VN890_05225 [Methylocella sp.]|nr:hypothetical protein [Methylocella sp.]